MIDKILSAGITPHLNFEQSIKTKLLNVVSLIFFLVLLFFMSLHIFFSHKYLVALLLFLFAVSVSFILFFQHKKKYTVAKIIFFSLLNTVVFVLSMFLLPGKGVENFYMGTTILVLILVNRPFWVYVISILEVVLYIAPHIYLHPYPIQNYSFITTIVATLSTLMAVWFFIIIQNRYKQTLELQKDRLEKLNLEKNDLVKIVAHDLKNPLTQIKGLVSMLELTNSTLTLEQKQLITKIKYVTESQHKEIAGLLETGSLEADFKDEMLERVYLRRVVETVLDDLLAQAIAKGIKLTYVKRNQRNLAVLGKEAWLSKVVSNLISNAIKHSTSGTEISISIQATKEKAHIIVKDQGKGFSPNELKNIFANNTTANGIGLYIVNKYVNQMNGQLEVKSSEGQGATFSVLLPLI